MRLFLSSQDLGRYPHIARELAGPNNKAAYVKNAQDHLPPEVRNFSTPDKKAMFEAAGFEFEEIDLRDYFSNQEDLRSKLSGFGSFWAAGGNAFILRRAFEQSGLSKLLPEMLKNDEILYGGWSAGAMVMAPDLKGVDWDAGDRPKIVPAGYDAGVIWEGLAQVPFYIVPHIGNKKFGDRPQGMASYYESKNLSHYDLSDGQVLIVNGDHVELLS